MTLTAEQLTELESNGFLLLRRLLAGDALNTIDEYCRERIQAGRIPRAGIRNLLGSDSTISELADGGLFLGLARTILGPRARPVRVILFDKTPDTNWGVPWHQDLNIAVVGDDTPAGYGPRTTKEGVPHIIPPADVLEKMVTIRLHLDECSGADGPLVVAPRSHQCGRVKDSTVDLEELEKGGVTCCASPGDVLVMRPLLFHRSPKATTPRARRVLHIEYAAAELDGDLDWYFAPRWLAAGEPDVARFTTTPRTPPC